MLMPFVLYGAARKLEPYLMSGLVLFHGWISAVSGCSLLFDFNSPSNVLKFPDLVAQCPFVVPRLSDRVQNGSSMFVFSLWFYVVRKLSYYLVVWIIDFKYLPKKG